MCVKSVHRGSSESHSSAIVNKKKPSDFNNLLHSNPSTLTNGLTNGLTNALTNVCPAL